MAMSGSLRSRLWAHPIIAIVRGEVARDPQGPARPLVDATVPTIEVTVTTSGGLDFAEEMSDIDGSLVGVGTVLTDPQVRDAVPAGARFAVTPAGAGKVERPCHEVGPRSSRPPATTPPATTPPATTPPATTPPATTEAFAQ